MKQFIKIVSVSISIFLLISASCSVAFASPDNNTFSFPFSKPTVTEYSGYVELIFRNKSTGYVEPRVLSWFFTPISTSSDSSFSDKPYFTIVRNASQFRLGYSSNSGTYGIISFVESNRTNTSYNSFEIFDNESTYFYNLTLGTDYELIGMHYYGDFESVTFNNAADDYEFYFTYSEDSVFTHQLAQIINALTVLIGNSGDYELDYTQDLSNILLALNNLDASTSAYRQEFIREVGKLLDLTDDVLSKIDKTNEYLRDTYLLLETYLVEMRGWLEELYWIELDSNGKLYEIKDTLDAILQILQQKTDTEFTTVNQDEFNSFYDVENSLLNPDVDVSDVMNVEVNQNALTVIWDLVERGLQSHGKVFGMVLTILALGIVALILGR